jgi:hypothetical protein
MMKGPHSVVSYAEWGMGCGTRVGGAVLAGYGLFFAERDDFKGGVDV